MNESEKVIVVEALEKRVISSDSGGVASEGGGDTKPVTPVDAPSSEFVEEATSKELAEEEGVVSEVLKGDGTGSTGSEELEEARRGIPQDLAAELTSNPMSFEKVLPRPDPIVVPTAPPVSEGTSPKVDEKVSFADMWVGTMNMAVSSVCSVISGEEKEKFKLSETEQMEYKQVSEAYFKTVDYELSPGTLFAVSSLTIFGGSIAGAVSIKREKIKAQKALQAEKASAAKDMELLRRHLSKLPPIGGDRTESEVVDSLNGSEEEEGGEPKKDAVKRKRSRFDVNKKTGYYMFDSATNERLKVDEQWELPSEEIQALLDGKKSNREIQVAIYGKALGKQKSVGDGDE